AEQLAATRSMRARALALRDSDAIGELDRRCAAALAEDLRATEIEAVALIVHPIFERLASTIAVSDQAVARDLERDLYSIALNGTIDDLERAVDAVISAGRQAAS